MVTVKTFAISSPAFEHMGHIPSPYTCEGEAINPPIYFHNVPLPAKSLVLIMDDPDAPKRTFDHWLVWNISPTSSMILENNIPGTEGMNSAGDASYHGPCPPEGTHHYVFRVYALDIELDLSQGEDRKKLEEVMEGHVLATAEMIGLYKKRV